MRKYCPANERIKRDYFVFLKEAQRRDEASVDAVAAAIATFEAHTKYRDFKAFHFEQAVAFKRALSGTPSATTGKPLSKATLYGTLSHLKRFFHWLAGQPGYRSKFSYSDSDYFNVSEKEARIATARRSRPTPTMEQVRHVIGQMPTGSVIQRRNRAIVAFILLTGARDSAAASAKLKHLDLISGAFYQDAREVKTKYSKTFVTTFFPVGDDIRRIVADWAGYLRTECLWGLDDPLFPKTRTSVGASQNFEHVDFAREHWSNAQPIRAIFKESFEAAGLPYYHPHSVRHTLTQLGERLCRTPEHFKAWSQNLGHEGVMTTFMAYGKVSEGRQREIIACFNAGPPAAPS
jgi:integrase/recombinase XerD